MTRHGEFAALDLQTGDILFETVMPTAGVYATPVIRDSVLYITGSDSDVTAIDAVSGEVIWHVLTAPYVYQDCMGGKVRAEYRLTTPIMHGGRIYVGSGDGKVYALNLDDGEGLWECPLSGYAMGDPCLADSTLFVVSYTDRLNAINIDHGELLWFMEIGTELVYAKPAVLEKKVFVASRDGQVFAISLESRQVTWARSVGTRFMTGPVVADDNVWIADESGVYCLAADDGSVRWRNSTPAVNTGLGDKHIYCVTRTGNLLVVDKDSGAISETYDVGPGHIFGAPLVHQGLLLVPTGDKGVPSHLSCFEILKR